MTATEPVRRFLVPGKLMVAGEYSVLAPEGEALALAVDPGIEVIAEPAACWELVRAESATTWAEGQPVPQDLSFAHEAWTRARAAVGEGVPPHRITTRTLGGMGVGEEKPGLGGSASATVGVAACCFALGGRDLVAERSSLLRLALDAHRRAQAGHGSGYDVATVLHGGVVLWRPRLLEARQLAWPDGLHFIAGYSGQSASTGALLGRAGRRAPDAPADLGRLAREVRRLVAAFSRGEVPEILDSVRACRRELSEWDRRHGLGIVTAALARMMEGAEALGAAAKISGAGGGDSVLAFADRADVLHGVARAWRAEGFEPLTVALSSRGVEELSAP